MTPEAARVLALFRELDQGRGVLLEEILTYAPVDLPVKEALRELERCGEIYGWRWEEPDYARLGTWELADTRYYAGLGG